MPERLTPEEGRERARGVLAGAVSCMPIQELEESEWPDALAGTVVMVTEEVPAAQAVALYRECKRQRAASRLSPLIVTRAGYGELRLREWLAPDRPATDALAAALAAHDTLTAERFFAERRERGEHDAAEMIDSALDDLARVAGCDPMSVLHRIRLGDLEAIAGGEDFEPADLLPDDVEAAHATGLAEREAMREMARRRPGPSMILEQPIRAFDEDSALAAIEDGPTRLLLVSAPPAAALLVLGFGGFNDCPPPAAQARVWEHWRGAIGAEPVLLDGASLTGVVARPVATRAALVQFAAEVALYDPDALQNGGLALAGLLVRSAGVDFWWD